MTRQQGELPKIRVWLPWGARDFSVCHNIHSKSGAHLSSYSVGTRHCIPNGVKQLEHEAEHLPPRGMLKKASPFVIVEWCLLSTKKTLPVAMQIKSFMVIFITIFVGLACKKPTVNYITVWNWIWCVYETGGQGIENLWNVQERCYCFYCTSTLCGSDIACA